MDTDQIIQAAVQRPWRVEHDTCNGVMIFSANDCRPLYPLDNTRLQFRGKEEEGFFLRAVNSFEATRKALKSCYLHLLDYCHSEGDPHDESMLTSEAVLFREVLDALRLTGDK